MGGQQNIFFDLITVTIIQKCASQIHQTGVSSRLEVVDIWLRYDVMHEIK